MEIHATGDLLAMRLRDSAPDGVVVHYIPPIYTRDFQSVAATVIITLTFSAHVDLNAVAAWLLEKLSASKGTRATSCRTDIKFELGALKLAIKNEIETKTKQKD